MNCRVTGVFQTKLQVLHNLQFLLFSKSIFDKTEFEPEILMEILTKKSKI